MSGLLDVLFPYRAKKTFGAASFALVFLIVIAEIEALALVALGIVAHRFDLFVDLQYAILPTACVVAVAVATVFWWRARAWSRRRVEIMNVWARGGTDLGTKSR